MWECLLRRYDQRPMAESSVGYNEPLERDVEFRSEEVDGAHTLAVILRDPGEFGYRAGTSGTVDDIPVGARIAEVACLGGTGGGTVEINGGDTITVPEGTPFQTVLGVATADTEIVFTGTDSYYVAYFA